MKQKQMRLRHINLCLVPKKILIAQTNLRLKQINLAMPQKQLLLLQTQLDMEQTQLLLPVRKFATPHPHFETHLFNLKMAHINLRRLRKNLKTMYCFLSRLQNITPLHPRQQGCLHADFDERQREKQPRADEISLARRNIVG
ncbi:hypothetical protein [Chryseolinea lacunae]|uniref:Uncharacterized protein n=1 Tax=Chryseolinea lacunae TaxID=2801331 RepID=A0ABS1KTH8_9BACT|nr:hypothetical protein [Chryseolinea lacunae]MBL0742736.1 hypothetical protein [Chryseolinea lacunae]